ncbi:hypothetical protein LTR62_007716 [Meristemomyces frigidus]|uniref:Zn(2)-C6 fungal-type domain-containing protein n=1 Tax=Meristemomyces frigidus TaxID=1508187 RepID=A0AAN7TAC1_9PEZI|nr:hypothetical protein LTR62_007716 [Meristemomyces frigidus]
MIDVLHATAPMIPSDRTPVSSARKGTRSCVDCRQRKVKCIWPTQDSTTCKSCLERHQACVAQQPVPRDRRAARVTSRHRIAQLEHKVSTLFKVVQKLERQAGGPNHDLAAISTVVEHAVEPSPSSLNEDNSSESGQSEATPANAPTHLRQLFNDGSLDYAEVQNRRVLSKSNGTSDTRWSRARALLLRELPSRTEVAAIAANTGPWLDIVRNMLFASYAAESPAMVVAKWDKVQQDDANPTELAMLLITLATSVHQMQAEVLTKIYSKVEEGYEFARKASDVIETVIVMDNVLAMSLEGLEVCCWWVRLQLLSSHEKTYLVLRRVIAIAELLGLPKAAHGMTAYEAKQLAAQADLPLAQQRQAAGVALWAAIRAADRLACLLIGFPLGTRHYPFAREEPFRDGRVDPQTYLCRLADIASDIPELDDLSSQGAAPAKLCDRALQIDQQLRQLYGSVPKSWWESLGAGPSPDGFLQHFHNYVIVRTHMKLALQDEASSQFAYSELVCMDACRELARRYTIFRRYLPSGFFASRVLDLQALTVAIVLLKKQHQAGSPWQAGFQDDATLVLLDDLLKTMDIGASLPGGRVAQQAAYAIRAIATLLQDKASSDNRSLSLKVPLLGRIDVRRKQPLAPATSQSQTMPAAAKEYWPRLHEPGTLSAGLSPDSAGGQALAQDVSLQDQQSWSMEISALPTFFSDDALGQDPWELYGFPDISMGGFPSD